MSFSNSNEFTRSKLNIIIEEKSTKNKKKTNIVIGVAVGFVVLIAVVVLLVIIFVLRKRKLIVKEQKNEQTIETMMSSTMYNSADLFSNPLYGEDYHDSRDPFNESDFDEDL